MTVNQLSKLLAAYLEAGYDDKAEIYFYDLKLADTALKVLEPGAEFPVGIVEILKYHDSIENTNFIESILG